MHRLNLAPDQTQYAVNFDGDSLRIQNDGAAGAYARNVFNNANVVSCLWLCSKSEYDYLAACHRAAVKEGGPVFEIDLLLDDAEELTTYKAFFVPNTFSLASVRGETFTVQAQLEIVPIPYDADNLPFVVDPALAQRVLKAGIGVYSLQGMPSSANGPARLVARVGTFGLFGSNVTFTKGRIFSVSGATYTRVGFGVEFDIVSPGTGITRTMEDSTVRVMEDGTTRIEDE